MRLGFTFNQKTKVGSPPAQGNDATPDDGEAEWDSPETIAAIHRVLAERHEVIPVEANEDAYSRLRAARPDLVFNVAEGRGGPNREALIPAMLEFLGIPYTGSDPQTLAICLDKARTKEVLASHDLPTPPFRVFEAGEAWAAWEHGFPAVVKPLHEGSSMGIFDDSVVDAPPALAERVRSVHARYRQPAIVERFLPGAEFTVALLGNGRRLEALPIVEIDFSTLPPGARPLYSYEAKWVWDVADRPLRIFRCPADLPLPLASRIEETARAAFRALRCRDWCRIDLRLDESGTPHVLELNPLPGILPDPRDNSCFPKAAHAAGLTYSDLLHRVVDEARTRYGLH